MEQTALKWLIEQINKDVLGQSFLATWKKEFEQAKEMEKEQIIDSYCDGRLSVINKKIISAEQYYNETFKSE